MADVDWRLGTEGFAEEVWTGHLELDFEAFDKGDTR